jgi:SWI/SNF-related matrix-associated actin-dependent regulator of chromatin subfamily A3
MHSFVSHVLTTSRYVHKITKARSSDAPTELGGGILADEMGMGKSLSILSLVMKTLRDGHSWAAEEVLPSPEDNIQPKRRVRGTLVIVWSARMSPLLLNCACVTDG